MAVKIVYSPQYLKYHFGPSHPLQTKRAKEFIELLRKKRFNFDLVKAPKATVEDILLVHTKSYFEKVKMMAEAGGGFLSDDTPVNKDNFESVFYMIGGSIKACELALKGMVAVNTQGGMHHAKSYSSSGFCIFNDHAITIKRLQKQKQIKTAVVLDLDVHAGNGTEEIFYSDPSVLTISIHQDPTNFYPGTGFESQKGEGKGKGFNYNFPLPAGVGEEEYLPVLDRALAIIKDYKPDLLAVILGVDTFKLDPLASFGFEKETYGKIASRLKGFRMKELSNTGQAIMFAGGYSAEVPSLWWEFVKNF